MAKWNVIVPDDLAASFDAWAGAHGGRSPALRQLIAGVAGAAHEAGEQLGRLPSRPMTMYVRLTAEDARDLAAAAAKMQLTRTGWVAALVRRRLHACPTFGRTDEVALLGIQIQLRRIGVNVNQIARAISAESLQSRVPDPDIAYFNDLRREIRACMSSIWQAFAGNLAYWDVEL